MSEKIRFTNYLDDVEYDFEINPKSSLLVLNKINKLRKQEASMDVDSEDATEYLDVMDTMVDIVSAILKPVSPLPEGKTKRDIITECLGSRDDFEKIVLFFSESMQKDISSARPEITEKKKPKSANAKKKS